MLACHCEVPSLGLKATKHKVDQRMNLRIRGTREVPPTKLAKGSDELKPPLSQLRSNKCAVVEHNTVGDPDDSASFVALRPSSREASKSPVYHRMSESKEAQ